jgi:hypothetical protein
VVKDDPQDARILTDVDTGDPYDHERSRGFAAGSVMRQLGTRDNRWQYSRLKHNLQTRKRRTDDVLQTGHREQQDEEERYRCGQANRHGSQNDLRHSLARLMHLFADVNDWTNQRP